MTKCKVGAAIVAATLTTAPAAHAAVVSGVVTGGAPGGVFQELVGGGFSVGNDNFQTNNIYAFDEAQGVSLAANLAVDGGSIAAGTAVDSHYVFVDPDDYVRVQGDVTFSGTILGVISDVAGLTASDGLGDPAVTYLSPSLRGLEAGEDSYSVSGNVLSIDFHAGTPGDYIRVLTEAAPVPLPAGGLLLLSGLGALIARRRAK